MRSIYVFPILFLLYCMTRLLSHAAEDTRKTLIDDFEWATVTPTSDLGPGGWQQASSSKSAARVITLDGGKVLSITGASTSGYNNLTKGAVIPYGESGTVSFRFRLPAGYAGDATVGLSSVSAGTAGSTLASNMAASIRFLSTGALTILDGSTNHKTDQQFAPGVWYEVSITVDTLSDTWSASVAGGAHAEGTKLTRSSGAIDSFAFRGSTGAISLTHFAVRANTAHGAGAELYLDDVWLETAADSPIFPNKADGYRGIWYSLGQFSQYGDKYSGGLGTYTANHVPLAIYAPEVNKTFFVWGGTKRGQRHLLVMASWYDHERHCVPHPTIVYDKQGVDDPHDDPSLSIDDLGHLWVFVAGRATQRPGILLRSKEPYSTDAFEEVLVMPGMTYPQPWHDAARGGFLLLFTKYTAGRELYMSTSADGKAWSQHKKLAGFGGHYQVSSQHVPSGRVGTFFNWHPSGNVDQRTNLYYMETADRGETWTTVDGDPLTLPLNSVSNDARVLNLHNQVLQYTCDLNWDQHGRPLILYVASRHHQPGPNGDPREWRLTRWTGTEWKTHVICTSTHNYDMGSIHVDGDRWSVICPTGDGPQRWGTGGEMEIWTSDDEGETWKRQRAITHGSEFNHSYARRPIDARDPFFSFWADGNPDSFSESRLYFTNRDGTRVWRLPIQMTTGEAAPEEIHPPYERWRARHFSEQEMADPAISGPSADADGDGRKNLLEHALGSNPRMPDPAALEALPFEATDGQTYLSLSYFESVDAADVLLIPEVADSPGGPWFSGSGHVVEVERARFNTEAGEFEDVHVRDSQPVSGTSKRFMRLRAISLSRGLCEDA